MHYKGSLDHSPARPRGFTWVQHWPGGLRNDGSRVDLRPGRVKGGPARPPGGAAGPGAAAAMARSEVRAGPKAPVPGADPCRVR